ncbi:thiamine pyrophosphate-dependent dehydrogenase E1 component subunit alpha [Aeromicrobium sp. Leaf350]|uniref:thiamine pyrophosphate-dependent dehydrogenase E1 component subunit alpha n=1 Tax=Aeromicrobium sp. Leaf350 TaxID=2876565 RepID=UPI001E4C7D81|nr:thiamine pyrophosphate-dependent dehydrogenase E1 component subunit alpha [Aeromicrobium sp. Leaf350]
MNPSLPTESDESDLVRLLTPEGARVEHADAGWSGTDADLFALYRDMVLTRRIDTEGYALQRHGELGLWPPCLGQEAVQVGTAHALRAQDMAFPTYRDHGVAWVRGVPPERLLGIYRGTEHGGWDPAEHGIALPAIIIGAQTLHAAGYAMGVLMDEAVGHADSSRDAAVAVYLGDGATSQGDTLEAMSWAASFSLPLVFVIENNQYAISTATSRQTTVPLVRRAAGFGIHGVRVDGNDVLASQAVMEAALGRARDGHGPTVIEAVTYRRGAHTTSDDPSRYRAGEETEYWEARDPIARVRVLLDSLGTFERELAELDAEAEALGERLRSACRTLPEPDLAALFDLVHVETTPELREQQEAAIAWKALDTEETAS